MKYLAIARKMTDGYYEGEPVETGMNTYDAIGLCEGFVKAESEDQIIEAWQYLHDTGLAYRMQGWFGRMAQAMIEEGVITP